MGKVIIRCWLFRVICPLVVGGTIYLLWRPQGLLMFDWVRALRLYDSLVLIRGVSAPLGCVLPEWIVFSLPNALWVYAFMSTFLLIWRGEKMLIKKGSWFLVAAVICLGSEIAQGFGFLSGTFDVSDLVLCFIAFFVAFIDLPWMERRKQ